MDEGEDFDFQCCWSCGALLLECYFYLETAARLATPLGITQKFTVTAPVCHLKACRTKAMKFARDNRFVFYQSFNGAKKNT